MQREALVLRAQHDPMPGIAHPGPHQTYRRPRIAIERGAMPSLEHGDVRLEMLYAGLCGTDLHLIDAHPATGYIRTSSPVHVPESGRIFGHEGIGRVVESGPGARRLPPGAIVAIESIIACGSCDACLRGFPNQCHHSRLIGLERDGLFATVADVPASVLHDVSAFIGSDDDMRALACLEPAGVALVACRNGRMAAGENLVIFGAGPIGLCCAMLAREVFDAGCVHIVEPVPFRRQLAAQWANVVCGPEEFEAQSPGGIDVAIETSGCMGNVAHALPGMNAHGRIVVLARSGEPLTLPSIDCMITNAVSIVGSRGHLGAFGTLLEWYARGRFQPGRIVTRVADGLGEFAGLLAHPADIPDREGKVLVKISRS